jgi:signal transduction histidine kinase
MRLPHLPDQLTRFVRWVYRRFIDPSDPSLSIEERYRVILFNSLIIVFLPIAPLITLSATNFTGGEWGEIESLVLTITATVGLLLCYAIHRAGHYRFARWLTMGIAMLLILAQTEVSLPPYPDILYLLILPTAGVMLFSRREMIILSTITTALILIALMQKPDSTYAARNDFTTLAILLSFLLVVTSYYRDVLERKRTQIMVEQASALRVERERVRVLTDFIQTASHDLRTPMSIINTSAALAARAPDPERRAYHLDKLQNGVHTLQNILERIFYTIGLEAITPDSRYSVNLIELMRSIAEGIQDKVQRQQIAFRIEIDPGLPVLNAHGMELHVALQELTRNALENTPPGGAVALTGCLEAGQIVMTVHDTGKGISADDLPRVLDLFYRVETHRPLEAQQIGLGLPIARKIAELHGGSLTLESTEGVGTRATIRLPIPS